MFGDCCIPCLLLMLGATLSKGPGKACPPLRVVAGVAAARLVLMPLLGTAWLVAGKVLGGWHVHVSGYAAGHCVLHGPDCVLHGPDCVLHGPE